MVGSSDISVDQQKSGHRRLRRGLGSPTRLARASRRALGWNSVHRVDHSQPRAKIEGGLYRDLEGVLDEPALANVVLDSIRVGDFGELAQACLDERETFAYQIGVGQRDDSAPMHASRCDGPAATADPAILAELGSLAPDGSFLPRSGAGSNRTATSRAARCVAARRRLGCADSALPEVAQHLVGWGGRPEPPCRRPSQSSLPDRSGS